MVNQQKGVQQDTAYSAVVVNGIPVPISFLTQKGHRNIKNDIGIDGDTYHSLQLHYRQ